MPKEMKLKITQREGQQLLEIANDFVLPEKIGETVYSIAERALAQTCVSVHLYRELKSRSPFVQFEAKSIFGPKDNWEIGNPGWTLKEPDRMIEIRLSEDAREGMYWCLFSALHPASRYCRAAGIQAETIWPLAERVRITSQLRKDLGIDTAPHRKIELDPEPSDGVPNEELKA